MSEGMWPPERIGLTPGKRVLFLTKDLELIRKQLYEGLDLRMEDLSVGDLLDDINTYVMDIERVLDQAERRRHSVRDGRESES